MLITEYHFSDFLKTFGNLNLQTTLENYNCNLSLISDISKTKWLTRKSLVAALIVRHLFHCVISSWQQNVEPSGPSKPNLLSGCLWRKRPKTGPVENSVLPPVDTQNYCSISHASCGRTEMDLEQERGEEAEENNQNDRPPVRMSCEVKDLSNGRTHTSLRTVPHLHTNNPRFRSMHAREKKATQMLAIVLGELRPS